MARAADPGGDHSAAEACRSSGAATRTSGVARAADPRGGHSAAEFAAAARQLAPEEWSEQSTSVVAIVQQK